MSNPFIGIIYHCLGGLVQFFMIAGPARIEGDTLVFDRLPVRAKFPIKVTIAAWQWGRPVTPKIRIAATVTQEFLIQK